MGVVGGCEPVGVMAMYTGDGPRREDDTTPHLTEAQVQGQEHFSKMFCCLHKPLRAYGTSCGDDLLGPILAFICAIENGEGEGAVGRLAMWASRDLFGRGGTGQVGSMAH